MSEWRTIDSAPKDGTELLLAAWTGRRWFVTVGQWQDDVVQTHCTVPARWLGTDGESDLGEMTHWMPLPAPPEGKA